jgi:hypothetical protein
MRGNFSQQKTGVRKIILLPHFEGCAYDRPDIGRNKLTDVRKDGEYLSKGIELKQGV